MLRSNLKKASVAYFLVETVDRLTREGEKNVELYDLINSYLGLLQTSTKSKRLKEEFIVKAVTVLGFWPKGKALPNPVDFLQSVAEREMVTARVGKKVLA